MKVGIQNRNFGITNMIKNSVTHSAKITPYNFNLANSPFPSVNFLNRPILLSAASSPVTFFSNASAARSTMEFDDSRVSEKATVLFLSAVASCRRESVRFSCSALWWLRRVSLSVRPGWGWVLDSGGAKGLVEDEVGLRLLLFAMPVVVAVSSPVPDPPFRARSVDVRFAAAALDCAFLALSLSLGSSMSMPDETFLIAGA